MFMEVLCCILMLACYVVVYIQIRLEDKWYYGAIYEAEKIRYERACRRETMSNFNNKDNALAILDGLYSGNRIEYYSDYCALWDAISEINEPMRWIPCEESLPKEGEDVLACIEHWETGEKTILVTERRDYNSWRGYGRVNNDCVAWIPLPPPYERGR